MGLLVNQHNTPNLRSSAASSSMVAMILSNQSAAAYMPGAFPASQNRLPTDTFEWQMSRASTSSVSSLPARLGTN